MLLGHVGEEPLFHIRVSGVVLNQAQNVRRVNVAKLLRLRPGDDCFDLVFEQVICVVGLYFGQNILVILKTLDENAAVGGGHKMSGFVFYVGASVHIIDALILIHPSKDEVPVCVILHGHLHLAQIALAVGEFLGQVYAVDKHMAVVNQSVVVLRVAALPDQDHIVGVSGVAVYHGVVRMKGTGIGNPHRAVGIAAVHHTGIGIYCGAGVDFVQTLICHGNAHHRFARVSDRIGDREFPGAFIPGRDLICTVGIPEKRDKHIALVVGKALGECIGKAVVGEIRGSGGDGRQGGDDLVVQRIAVRGSGGMGVAVGDICCAVIDAGTVHGFPDGLFKRGDAGQVLGIESDVIDPAFAAVLGVGAVDAGHGHRHKEG